ncbi:MAG: ATP-binding protein [Candidatus Paceibacterota bacterium]
MKYTSKFRQLGTKYTDYIIQNMISNEQYQPNLPYWRNIFFSNIIALLVPLSLIPLIPGLYLAYISEMYGIIVVNMIIIISIVAIAFVPNLSINTRKILFSFSVYLLAIALLYYMGTFGPGLSYLLGATFIIVMIAEQKYAIASVGVNILICFTYAGMIYYGYTYPIEGEISYDGYDAMAWLGVSFNIIILSALAAFIVPKLFYGLQSVIDSKNILEKRLKHSLDLVESKNSELEEFAYTASHDLKEPLRMIRSFMGLLKKNYAEKLDERANRFIHFAVDGSDKMAKLIDDLLSYSRVGRINTEIFDVDMNMVVNEITKSLNVELESRNGTIEYENLPTIRAVPVTMKLLLQNLISNGLKYQKEDSKPEIKIKSYESENYYHFSVIDNGIGIDEKYFDKIFLLFNRLHGNETYQGSGLGLALCKKIVEQHGGTIGVKSTYGIGSEFFFTIKKEDNESI